MIALRSASVLHLLAFVQDRVKNGGQAATKEEGSRFRSAEEGQGGQTKKMTILTTLIFMRVIPNQIEDAGEVKAVGVSHARPQQHDVQS